MRTSLKALTVATALIVGIATAPALYAQSDSNTTGTITTPMGQGNMSQDQSNMPMSQGNMMGMMTQMMKTHTNMMKQMMEKPSKAGSDKKQ